MWQKHRVDLAIYGRVHNYERTCPVYENTCMDGGGDGNNKDKGSSYSGTMGGTVHTSWPRHGRRQAAGLLRGAGAAAAVERGPGHKSFGYVKLTATTDHSSLRVEFIHSDDGAAHDAFDITRDYKDVLACTVDSCAPHTLAN